MLQEDIQGLPFYFSFSHQLSCFLKSLVADDILKFNFILLFPKWEASMAHTLGRDFLHLAKFRVKFQWPCRKPSASNCEIGCMAVVASSHLSSLQRRSRRLWRVWVGCLLNRLPNISSGYVLHWASPSYAKSCVQTHCSPFESNLLFSQKTTYHALK